MILPNTRSSSTVPAGSSDTAIAKPLFDYESPDSLSRLFRRKGGGGHGGGHASSGKGGSSSSSKGSPASSHGASSSFTSSRGAIGFSISKSGKSSTTATAYSTGGGKRITLGSDTSFNGRQAGGGDRSTIYGTSRFGSGYPYGDYGYYVDDRPFPYYFYPTPPSYGYYGGDEYLKVNETERPGGNLVSAIIQPSWNASSVTYRILGDNNSVTAVFDALVANCSVANSSSAITAYTPSANTWPLPEQIIQYYRASSFSLSLDGYNNSASLLSNMPVDNNTAPLPLSQDTSLPVGLNDTFLVCVNTTIGASIPLEDVVSHKLTGEQIAEIVGLSIQGFIVLLGIVCCFASCCGCKRKSKKDAEKAKPPKKYDLIHRNISIPPFNIRPYDAQPHSAKIYGAQYAPKTETKQPSKKPWWSRSTPFVRSLGYRAIRPDAGKLPEADKHEEQESAKGSK